MKSSDHVLAIIKAAVSAVPTIGGPIASLIGDYVPLSTHKATKEAFDMLARKLDKMQERIDADAVNKDEFAELFKSCYLIIVRTHQKEKLNAAASLITNILLKEGDPDKLTYTELDHFVRCLDFLSIGAVKVLGKIFGIIKPEGNEPLYSVKMQVNFEAVRKQMADCDLVLLMSLLTELNSMNLVYIEVPMIKTENYGNYGIELTNLGTRFVTHLMKE